MHIHLHMQIIMSTDYKPEFKELGLCSNYNTIKVHPEETKHQHSPTQIYKLTCAWSFY